VTAASHVTVTLMTFDKQSNVRRIEVESLQYPLHNKSPNISVELRQPAGELLPVSMPLRRD